MRGYDAKNESDLLKLRRDNWQTENGWLLANGNTVTIAEQKNGQPFVSQTTIPREEFNRLIRGYLRNQKPRR